MALQLQPGIYIISNNLNGSFKFIARRDVEEESTFPKPIVTLPPGVLPPIILAPKVSSFIIGRWFLLTFCQWIVEKLPNGRYLLSTESTFVADIDGKVYAITPPDPAPTEWVITQRGEPNLNVYTLVLSRNILVVLIFAAALKRQLKLAGPSSRRLQIPRWVTLFETFCSISTRRIFPGCTRARYP